MDRHRSSSYQLAWGPPVVHSHSTQSPRLGIALTRTISSLLLLFTRCAYPGMHPHKVVQTIFCTTRHDRQRCIEQGHVADSIRSLASRGLDQHGTPGVHIRRGGDRFPATPEGTIQPDDIEQFVTLDTREVQFRLEQVAFRIEHLQVGIEAPKKTLIGEYGTAL